MRADRSTAERLLAEHPDLHDRLTNDDRATVVEAAGSSTADAVALMLRLGFTPHSRNGLGEQPLHAASYTGNAEAVQLLLAAGADVGARDDNFDGTPLAYATVGSGEQAGRPGNWVETVRLLVEAGASRDGAWIVGKPPSEEVMDLVRQYRITPDAPPEEQDDEPPDAPSSIGSGILAEVAHHLETAHRDLDLDLLGSLLHPEVHWTGLCNNRGEVLAWYRGLMADGVTATVQSVELDRDAVVLGLAVARQAEGARAAPAQHLYQVFVIDNAQVVDIRGYPDRTSALART